jgi:hypothetical protein
MEIMIYCSPKKYKIVAIKDYLIKNNIPITGIKLGFYLRLSSGGGKSGPTITEKIEKHDDLNIPIEEFNEILNDSQIFEIYIDEKYEKDADKLFENLDIETFFNDCIYKSNNYDEAFAIYQLLLKNNLQCDDIFTITDIDTNVEEHLLFLDPEKKEDALKIINEENRIKTYEFQNIKTNELFGRENNINTKYNNDDIFKAERIKPAISLVRRYYLLLGVILVSVAIFLIFVIVSAAQPINITKDNSLTQIYYYEIFTVSNENFIAVPQPALYFDPPSWKQSIKNYKDQLRANGSNLYSSRKNVTHNDIYEYFINFGLTSMESNKKLSTLNTMGNLLLSRPYQDDSGGNYMEVTYLEKK